MENQGEPKWHNVDSTVEIPIGPQLLVCIENGNAKKQYYAVVATARRNQKGGVEFSYLCLPHDMQPMYVTPKCWMEFLEMPFQDDFEEDIHV